MISASTNTVSPTAFALLQIIIHASGRGVTPWTVEVCCVGSQDPEGATPRWQKRDKKLILQGCSQCVSTLQWSANTTRAWPLQQLLPTQISQQLFLLASIHLRAPAAQFGLLLLSTDSQTSPKGIAAKPRRFNEDRAAVPVFDALGLLILGNIHVWSLQGQFWRVT